jgi:transcriptional regulator with XRE-family HTH domain
MTTMSGTVEVSNPFVEWLNGELARRGWTREELARRAHISSPGLTHIMNRQRNLGPEMARHIAKALQISQVEVFQRARLIDETINEDAFAERDIQRLLSEMDPEQRRIAISVLEAIARAGRDGSDGHRRRRAGSRAARTSETTEPPPQRRRPAADPKRTE